MPPPFNRLGKLLKKPLACLGMAFDRLVGLGGGLVCALAACMTAYYCWRVFHYHFFFLVAASVAFVVLFSALGLLLHRYFACFFVPVFNTFASPDGWQEENVRNEGRKGWLVWVLGIGLLVASLALAVGALFQIHLAFAAGLAWFCMYAVAAPMVFRDDRIAKSQ